MAKTVGFTVRPPARCVLVPILQVHTAAQSRASAAHHVGSSSRKKTARPRDQFKCDAGRRGPVEHLARRGPNEKQGLRAAVSCTALTTERLERGRPAKDGRISPTDLERCEKREVESASGGACYPVEPRLLPLGTNGFHQNRGQQRHHGHDANHSVEEVLMEHRPRSSGPEFWNTIIISVEMAISRTHTKFGWMVME